MEKQPELIGGGAGVGCAVGTKMVLEGFYVVLCCAATAVVLLLKCPGLAAVQISDDEAGVSTLIANSPTYPKSRAIAEKCPGTQSLPSFRKSTGLMSVRFLRRHFHFSLCLGRCRPLRRVHQGSRRDIVCVVNTLNGCRPGLWGGGEWEELTGRNDNDGLESHSPNARARNVAEHQEHAWLQAASPSGRGRPRSPGLGGGSGHPSTVLVEVMHVAVPR
jgi:hypothetical protein